MRLQNYIIAVPGGWRYTHPEPESHGHVSSAVTFFQLVSNAMIHRRNMGYLEDPDLASTIDSAICESLSPEDQRALCDGAPPEPWPLYLQPFKLLAQEGDKGLGDIVEHVIGPAGGGAYKSWYEKTFGVGCGCNQRQDRLNQRYPL